MTEWDKLTEEQKVERTRLRKLSGHTSVFEHDKARMEAVREQAFNEACDFLMAHGFAEASAALEAAAFEAGP